MNSTRKDLEEYKGFLNRYAGITTCLMCNEKFKSPDKRGVRRCPKCNRKERGVRMKRIQRGIKNAIEKG